MIATPRPGVPVRGSDTGRPIMALFDLASRRWTLRVIWELSRVDEPLTFRELRSRCAEMSSSVLTRRIAELREARLLTRDPRGYLLTELGRDLVTSMQPLLAWSRSWAAELDRAGPVSDHSTSLRSSRRRSSRSDPVNAPNVARSVDPTTG